MKICRKCNSLVPLSDFPPNKRCLDGKGSWCRSCCREYGKKYDLLRYSTPEKAQKELKRTQAYRENNRAKIREKQRSREAWRASLKNGPCQDCGGNFPTWSLDFDHVRGEKVKNIGRMVGGKQAVILAEVAKCDLVCACCHRVRTAKRSPQPNYTARQKFLGKLNALKAAPCLDCGHIYPPSYGF